MYNKSTNASVHDQQADFSNVYSHGILTEWNDERGYGFITVDNTGKKVFLHIKNLASQARRPQVGEIFFYQIGTDNKGRPQAENAFQTIFDEKRQPPFFYAFSRMLSYCWIFGAALPAFIVYIGGTKFAGICVAFVVNSLLSILLYATDKHLAQYKYWRIPEKNLQIWSFLYGWPGALYAQQVFKHKRKKISFMVQFVFLTIINIVTVFMIFFIKKFPAII